MDIGLEGYWCINKTKRYNHIFKMAIFGTESVFQRSPGLTRILWKVSRRSIFEKYLI